jgi:predicted N-acyltransferase
VRHRLIDTVAALDSRAWNALLENRYPFLRHEFLLALEQSGSVGGQTGWRPQHLVVEDAADGLVAAMPLYLKSHSYGEYVFDWSWAEAYQCNGLSYYPKALIAVPFTPATGPRLLGRWRDPGVAALLAQGLSALMGNRRITGWHCLFPEDTEDAFWCGQGGQKRLGCQYHWFNEGYADIEAFLAGFTSKRRKTLRRERSKVAEQGVRLQRLTGEAITPDVWELFWQFYRATYLKRSGHEGYLTPEFFTAIHASLRDQMLLVMAWQDDQPVAAALNFFSDDTLYGRYWGALRDIECLHFEACYYQGIEFAIERGLVRFDPGAQGEHKIPRGFRPVLTHSWHRLAHPAFHAAVGDFLTRETPAILAWQKEAANSLPFRDAQTGGSPTTLEKES